MFLHYHQYKTKTQKYFFANANKYPLQILSTSTPLCMLILHIHFTQSYTVLDKGEKINMKQSPYQLLPQQFLSSRSSFYIMLRIKRDKYVYIAVFQTSLHMKIKLTLRNMTVCPYCCYQKSPCQLCPHILVFMFKNYKPHRETDTHTHYVYCYKNVSIILMFTYENNKYTRSSKLIM